MSVVSIRAASAGGRSCIQSILLNHFRCRSLGFGPRSRSCLDSRNECGGCQARDTQITSTIRKRPEAPRKLGSITLPGFLPPSIGPSTPGSTGASPVTRHADNRTRRPVASRSLEVGANRLPFLRSCGGDVKGGIAILIWAPVGSALRKSASLSSGHSLFSSIVGQAWRDL